MIHDCHAGLLFECFVGCGLEIWPPWILFAHLVKCTTDKVGLPTTSNKMKDVRKEGDEQIQFFFPREKEHTTQHSTPE